MVTPAAIGIWEAMCRRAGLRPDQVAAKPPTGAERMMVQSWVAAAKARTKARTRGEAKPAAHGVLMVGPTGIGKTHLMMATALSMMCTGIPENRLVYGREESHLAPPDGTLFQPRDWRGWVGRGQDAAAVVFLDELGRGVWPNHAAHGLTPFLDWVNASGALVIAATNHDEASALEKVYPTHVVSRLRALFTEVPPVGQMRNGRLMDHRVVPVPAAP